MHCGTRKKRSTNGHGSSPAPPPPPSKSSAPRAARLLVPAIILNNNDSGQASPRAAAAMNGRRDILLNDVGIPSRTSCDTLSNPHMLYDEVELARKVVDECVEPPESISFGGGGLAVNLSTVVEDLKKLRTLTASCELVDDHFADIDDALSSGCESVKEENFAVGSSGGGRVMHSPRGEEGLGTPPVGSPKVLNCFVKLRKASLKDDTPLLCDTSNGPFVKVPEKSSVSRCGKRTAKASDRPSLFKASVVNSYSPMPGITVLQSGDTDQHLNNVEVSCDITYYLIAR